MTGWASLRTRLVDHLESRLGRLVYGWTKTPDGVSTPFQVGRFEGGDFPGTLAFATVGLSQAALGSRRSGNAIKEELLIIVNADFDERNVPAALQQVALEMLQRRKPILRGDLIEHPGSVLAGAPMSALYATRPVYFDEAFATLPADDGDIVIVWLVPLHAAEASLQKARGWRALEDAFAEQDAALFDPMRSSVV